MGLEWEISDDGSLVIRLVRNTEQGGVVESEIAIPESVFQTMSEQRNP